MTTTAPTPTPSGTGALPQFPWLPPVLRRAWRAPGVLQVGCDPVNAVVLHNVSPQMAAFIGSLDGTRHLDQVLSESALPAADATRALSILTSAGALVDLGEATAGSPRVGDHPALAGPLTPEMYGRALGNLTASPSQTIERRRRAHTVLVGTGRLLTALSGVLATAGVGRFSLVQPGHVRSADIFPGGPAAADLGRDRFAVTSEAVLRVNPSAIIGPLGASDRADLVVLTEPADPASERVRMLMRTRTPFLPVAVRERRAIVGPFVLPGESSCLQCQDATRTDLDRTWPAVRTQLLTHPVPAGDGGEVTVVTMGAALAAAQILQWIDGERMPETINATLEIALPDLVLERRYWPRHAACTCHMG